MVWKDCSPACTDATRLFTGNKEEEKRIEKNNQKLRNSSPHFHIHIYVTYLFTRNTEKQYTKICLLTSDATSISGGNKIGEEK